METSSVPHRNFGAPCPPARWRYSDCYAADAADKWPKAFFYRLSVAARSAAATRINICSTLPLFHLSHSLHFPTQHDDSSVHHADIPSPRRGGAQSRLPTNLHWRWEAIGLCLPKDNQHLSFLWQGMFTVVLCCVVLCTFRFYFFFELSPFVDYSIHRFVDYSIIRLIDYSDLLISEVTLDL